jgi:hypothetical protein
MKQILKLDTQHRSIEASCRGAVPLLEKNPTYQR